MEFPKKFLRAKKVVSVTPEAAFKLIKQGFKIQVEKGVGKGSNIMDSKYEAIGATINTT
jgi:NAD/NADP transhydrogenase alpha subunit